MNNNELIKAIQSAFADIKQPGKVTLHIAEAHDDRDYDNDPLYRKMDHIGRWQDLPEEHIERCQNALSHLDKIGLRYYLPAYIIWHLKNKDGRPIDYTFFVLDRDVDSDAQIAHQKEKYSLFTAAQLKAVAAYVKYCADELSDSSGASYATRLYDSYWYKHA